MKTKELIRILQEADPSGEIEVVVWSGANSDILYVDRQAGDFDGAYEVLVRDGSTDHCDVTGIKVTDKHEKVVIRDYPMKEVLADYPDINIDYDVDARALQRERNRVHQIKKLLQQA